jgi:Peptidase family M28
LIFSREGSARGEEKEESVRRTYFALLIVAIAISQTVIYAQRPQTKSKPPATATGTRSKSQSAGEFGNIEAITAAQLKDYLYFIASDEMEGRDTPSPGLDLTAKFLAMNLSRWGLKGVGTDGTFFQKFGLVRRNVTPEETSVSIGSQSFKIGEDFIAQPYAGKASGQLVYVGHGRMVKAKKIDPYQGVEVKDKIMLVADGFPKEVNYNDFRRGKPGVDYDLPESYAAAHGAKGIIVIPSPAIINIWDQRYKASLNPTRLVPESAQQRDRVPAILASEKMVNAILQGEKLDYGAIKQQITDGEFGPSFDLSAEKQVSINVGAKVETIKTQNVVAVYEGSDPVLKNEYVAIGAHYDHVGSSRQGSCVPVQGDSICNGADDDGSGTVAVLAIAEALAKGPRPKRSTLLVWHAGEEKGLWGSAYVTANPPVPINQIIAQLNIDMIGRSKKEGDTNPRNKNLTGPDEIYLIGSKMMSTELGELSEKVNNSFLKLKFNYKHDAPNDSERLFYRSDHYRYALRGIPIIFYFSGIHEDYHGALDHPDKIDYTKMEKVTRTILATLWELANAPHRPKVDKPVPVEMPEN